VFNEFESFLKMHAHFQRLSQPMKLCESCAHLTIWLSNFVIFYGNVMSPVCQNNKT